MFISISEECEEVTSKEPKLIPGRFWIVFFTKEILELVQSIPGFTSDVLLESVRTMYRIRGGTLNSYVDY